MILALRRTSPTAFIAPLASPAAIAAPRLDVFARGGSVAYPTPSASSSVPIDPALAQQLMAGRMGAQLATRGAGAPSPTPLESAAAKNYDQNGDKPFDLNDPSQRKQLIEASPQLDDLTSTTNDDTRCGAASIVNAMIASGDPAGNAKAIAKVAEDNGVAVEGDFAAALDAMKGGTLTPKQAAVLQDKLLEAGYGVDSDAVSGCAMSGIGVTELASQLEAAGAFGDAKEVRFNLQGDGVNNHWTTTVVGKDGSVVNANSWPSADGSARVLDYDPSPQLGDSRFLLDVTMRGQPDGSTAYQVRVPKDDATYKSYDVTSSSAIDLQSTPITVKPMPQAPAFDPLGASPLP